MAGLDREMLFLLGGVALLAIFLVIIPALRLRRARRWPTTQGTVEEVGLRREHSRSTDVWFSDVRYSYDAGQGRCTGLFAKGFAKKEQAEAFLTRFPKTTQLVVHYKPDAPSKSVVDEREQPFLRPS